MDLPTAAALKDLIAALAPGLIILGIRQRFVAGPNPPLQERAIAYAAVSALYYAIFNPAIAFVATQFRLTDWTASALEYVIVPVVIGAVVGIATSRDWSTSWWAKLRIQPVHHVPTAWDYAFSRLQQGAYILVTLSDGSTVAGRYAFGSFASSSREERDLLIGDVWEVVDGHWTRPPTPKSILLCGRDIRTVELFRQAEK
jgi:hypothetical protein